VGDNVVDRGDVLGERWYWVSDGWVWKTVIIRHKIMTACL
jgi:hypothetical protein